MHDAGIRVSTRSANVWHASPSSSSRNDPKRTRGHDLWFGTYVQRFKRFNYTFCSRYFFPLQNSDFLCFHSQQNHEKVFSFDWNKERFRKFSPSFNSFNYKKLSVFLIWFVEKNFNIKFTIVLYWFCRVEKDSIVWSLVSLNKATRNHLTSVIQFE